MKSHCVLLFFVFSLAGCVNVQKEAREAVMPQAVDVETLKPPQFEVPESGMSVKKEFTVVLRKTPTLPCISVPTNNENATLLISRRLLEQLVLSGREDPVAVRSLEQELHGQRAATILQAISESTDPYGCTTVARSIPTDSQYLLGRLIVAGQLAVVYNKTNSYLPNITVRYFSVEEVGGRVSYGDILSYRTWVR